MKRQRVQLGDFPVMAFIRIGHLAVPQTAVLDTFTRYSVLPRELAKGAGVEDTGKSGTLNVMRRAIHGRLVKVEMTSLDGRCRGKTTALVPDVGADWDKGLLLGGEFLQDTKMHVNAHGETYCPAPMSRVRRKR
jgi:hypothetical protein